MYKINANRKQGIHHSQNDSIYMYNQKQKTFEQNKNFLINYHACSQSPRNVNKKQAVNKDIGLKHRNKKKSAYLYNGETKEAKFKFYCGDDSNLESKKDSRIYDNETKEGFDYVEEERQLYQGELQRKKIYLEKCEFQAKRISKQRAVNEITWSGFAHV